MLDLPRDSFEARAESGGAGLTKGLKKNDTFRFWVYPSETTEEVAERLNYFRKRKWIDQETERVEIRMYLMNAELGRNRLEQLTVTLRFSEAGSVYYERDLQCYFLQFFYGNLSMAADFMFFIMLLLNTAYRLHGMWKACGWPQLCPTHPP